MRILGIDPGIAIVGFGLIESNRGSVRMLQYGAVTTEAGLPLATRLVQIENDMTALIAQLKPDEIAVEELFFSKNITTGIAVAHGRGDPVYGGATGRTHIRIYPHAGEAGGGRLRPGRQEAGDGHDEATFEAEGSAEAGRRGRRAGHRHMPCPQRYQPAAA